MLLPLRLETRRIDDDLCIRVFPDQPFVDTHQEALAQEELDLGRASASLRRVAELGPLDANDLDSARGEWRELARRYGSARAGWILEALRQTESPEVVDSASAKIPCLFLLPERFIFLIYQGHQLAYAKSGNDVNGRLTLLPKPTHDVATTPPPNGIFDDDSLWVSDFDSARTKGLAVRIPLLGPHRGAAVTFSEIVVVGLRKGGTEADTSAIEDFLMRHRHTGGVELLPYGTPTNNTGQVASGHSESDEQLLASYDVEVSSPLAAVSTERWKDSAAGRFARAVGLADFPASLLHVKGADLFPNDGFRELLRATWGATGDYFLKLLMGPQAPTATREMLLQHVADYLRPSGTLATLRVGNLPYGVLPVTRIAPASATDASGWKPEQNDRRADAYGNSWVAFDVGLHHALSALLPLWLERARDSSVVPRASTSGDPDEELLRILGMGPRSVSYRVRPVIHQTLIGFLMLLFRTRYFGAGSGFDGLTDVDGGVAAWQQEWQVLRTATIALLQAMTGMTAVPNSPLLRSFAWGNGASLYMPFVRNPDSTVTDYPEHYLHWLVQNPTNPAADYSATLLYDVLRRSLLMNPWQPSVGSALQLLTELDDYPIVSFFNNSVTRDKLQSLAIQDLPTGDALTGLINRLNDRSSGPYVNAATIKSNRFAAAPDLFDHIATALRLGFEERLDAGFRDLIDALTYRLDAWYSTLASRRLDVMRDRQPLGVHWGAYGYLEEVALPARTTLWGRPATGGGFIHAPSVAQANAAAILRSAYDSHRDDDAGNAYALNLTSRRVSRALTLIDGVQQGQELAVQLGYLMERGLHEARLDRLITRFRTAFPLATPDETDTDAPQEVVAPRNVCDGRALSQAYAASSSGLAGLPVDLTGVTDGEQDTVRRLIEGLTDATDAVGDLLLFEGVFHAVQGNYERSGSALDACAGLGRPPELESVTTHLLGGNLRQRVCLLLPTSEAASPGARAVAEPRLNKWVQDIFGDFADIGCQVSAEPGVAAPKDVFNLRVEDLDVSGLDFLHMCSALPTGTGDTEIELRLKRQIISTKTLAREAVLTIYLDQEPVDQPTGARSIADAMELGRTILEMLGNSSAVSLAALMHPDDASPGKVFTDEEVTTFRDRADNAKEALGLQITRLTSSLDEMRDALDVCAGFGIQEAVLGTTDDALIIERAAVVHPIVGDRVSAAGQLIGSVDTSQGGDERIQTTVNAFKALFGESFVALPTFDAPAGQQVASFEVSPSSLAIRPSEDRVWLWLQQVAETHPRVRTLETLLMAAEGWGKLSETSGVPVPQVSQAPLRPEFGWQALSDLELVGTAGRARGCQSIVALAQPAFALSNVAGFLIDEWTETIPASEVTTGVSFEYNQPGQQAPQCFLLAVPGNFDAPVWGTQHLAGIVRDTMSLARARLVDLDALPAVASLFPALLFPIPGALRAKPAPSLIQSDTLQTVYPPEHELAHAI